VHPEVMSTFYECGGLNPTRAGFRLASLLRELPVSSQSSAASNGVTTIRLDGKKETKKEIEIDR
jgi:hypothetical protein